jgi:membrane protease YdiL (CAAX protease family)
VQPLDLPDLDLSLRIPIVASMLISNFAHRDSFRSLGLRIDNLPRAASGALPATATAAGIVVALALIVGPRELELQRVLLNFVYYIFWGFAQQYALQGFVLQRLLDAGLTRRAPLAAGALFAIVHAPNPGLMTMTFAGGWMWCSLFRREPNLLILAVSHACLAVVADGLLPAVVTGGYHIGPSYLRWAATNV